MNQTSQTTLGDVADFINGLAFKPEDWEPSGNKIIRIQNLTDKTKPYNLTNRKVDSKFIVNQGDLLVSWSATLGVFQWDDEESAVLNQHIFRVIPDEKKVYKPFLKFALDQSVSTMDRHTHGATMKHINRAEFLNTPIHLPPLPEQKRIAAILDKADSIRRKRQEAVQLTEELLRSAFLDMFGDPVTNPKGWEKAAIKDFGTVMTGNTPSREVLEFYGDGIEWIKSDNINTPDHYLTKAREQLSPEGQKVGRVVPAGSILVTCIAGSPECIGNVALSNRDVAFNQQINAISPFNYADSFFLYSQILVAKKLIQDQSTESMKGMVSKGKFENILLIKPPIELQRQFGSMFRRVEALSKKNDAAYNYADTLFNSHLQRAFKGEL